MLTQDNDASVFNINKEYRIVKLKGNKCSLFFKNKQNQLLASLEGCQDIFTNILLPEGVELNKLEKGYLLSFIRAKKYAISKEVADILEVSIIKYLDGREEYLSEKQLLKRIERGIDFANVYVSKLVAFGLKIPADSKDCSYNLSNAYISRLTVEENCSINIDLRDNKSIESIVIGKYFTGTVNLSRSSIESVFLGDNCQCNLHVADSKKCFNLQISDIYSGNLNISNCCLYALGIGYYSYADITLSNNIVKKEIVIGDSFRGGLYATNQNSDVIRFGDDFKGSAKISNFGVGVGIKKVIIGDDFAGNVNVSGDESIENIVVGRKNGGKLDASYSGNLKKITTGKFFGGTIIADNSSIENIEVAYGASGNIKIANCNNLKLLQATVDNNIVVDTDREPKNVNKFDETIFYEYVFDAKNMLNVPFYKRIYRDLYNIFN